MELNNKKSFTRQNFSKENLGGFTLVELLVVAGIIIFLSAMVLVNYRSGSNEFALQRSAHKLAQDIRRAGELAMSAKEFGGSIPSGGYGIHLSSSWQTYYKLYADVSGDERYGPGDSDVENINLESGVYIQSISPASLSINFKPPAPAVRIVTEAGQDAANATITLSLISDSSKKRVVKINAVGLIDID